METVLPQLATGHQVDLPRHGLAHQLRRRAGPAHGPARTRRMGRPHRAPGRRAHGAELPAAVADADLDPGPRPRPHRAALGDAARLRGHRRPAFLARAAGRPGAAGRAGRADRLDAARRQQRRRLGPHRRARSTAPPCCSRTPRRPRWRGTARRSPAARPRTCSGSGRHTERAENAVRLARLTLDLLGGEDLSARALPVWLHQLALRNALVPSEVPSLPQVAPRLRARADRRAGRRRRAAAASAGACAASASRPRRCASGCRRTTGTRSCGPRATSCAAAPSRPASAPKAATPPVPRCACSNRPAPRWPR